MKLIKFFWIFTIGLYIQNTQANDLFKVPVYDMITTNFDVMFELKSSKKFDRVVLDCQSFIHGLNFYKQNTEGKIDIFFKFYLDSNECLEIYQFIDESLTNRKHACIELDSYSNEYYLSNEYKDCN